MYKNVYIYLKNMTFISTQVISWFLPNLRRLNKIKKSVNTTNLKSN